MRDPMTMLDALTLALRVAEDNPIGGRRRDIEPIDAHFGPKLSLVYERGWGMKADVCVRFDRTGDAPRAEVDVSWSMTHYTPAAARAAAVLHAEVADLACLIEATLARETIALEK